MSNLQFFEDISLNIKQLTKESPVADLEKNINALLQGAFTKLALVSREEFDVQAELLRVTRQKLALLEKRIDALESDSQNLQ